MSSFKKKAGEILDPANFFGKREGGVNWANAMDPGGSFIKSATGSDIGRKVADPLELYSNGKVQMEPPTILTSDQKREKRLAAASTRADEQRRRRLASRSILTTKTTDEHY